MTSATRITGLTNGTSYDVRVRACNTDGDYCGDWSEAASGILPQPPPMALSALYSVFLLLPWIYLTLRLRGCLLK